MAVVIPQVVTEDRASGAQVIDGSLRFDKDKLTYLSWTPSSSGNRNNWTISCWIKRGKIGTANQRMFETANNFAIRFGADNFQWIDGASGANGENTPVAKLRDTGWYHCVFAWDSSAGVLGNRIYLNGVELDYVQTGAGNPNTSSGWNVGSSLHTIGRNGGNTSRYYDGMMTQCYFVEGQTLGPEYFGYTDPLTNTWRPKKLEFEKRSFTNPRWYSSATLYTTTADVIANATDRGNGGVTVTNEYLYLVFNDGGYAHNGGSNNAPDYPVWSDLGTFNEVTRVFYYNSSAWVNAASYGTSANEWNSWRYSNSTAYSAYRVGKDFAIDEKMLVFCDDLDSANPSTAGKLASATLPTLNTNAFHVKM